MAHLSGTDRSQLLLLFEVVNDYVGPDNPVRFIIEHPVAALPNGATILLAIHQW